MPKAPIPKPSETERLIEALTLLRERLEADVQERKEEHESWCDELKQLRNKLDSLEEKVEALDSTMENIELADLGSLAGDLQRELNYLAYKLPTYYPSGQHAPLSSTPTKESAKGRKG